MLAARAGAEDEVRAVTEAAMRGELEFAESLRARVATLAGLPESVLAEVAGELELTPGARTTIRTLKRLGFRCGVVSGGFTRVIAGLADELALDFVAANELEVRRRAADRPGRRRDRRPAGQGGRAASGSRERRACCSPSAWRWATAPTTSTCSPPRGSASRSTPSPRWPRSPTPRCRHPYLDVVLFVLGITRDEVERADAADGLTAVSRSRRRPLTAPPRPAGAARRPLRGRARGPGGDPARAGRGGARDADRAAVGAAARGAHRRAGGGRGAPRSRSAWTRAPPTSGATRSPPGWRAASARSPDGPAARTGRPCRSCRGSR